MHPTVRSAPAPAVPAVDDLVVVRAGGHAYGIPVRAVVEVTRMVALTPLPDVAPWVCGVMDLRGTPVPVLDLATRLGTAARTPLVDRRIVVVGDPADPVGVVVDEVAGVLPPGPVAAGTATSPLVRRTVRVGPDLVMVLNESALQVKGDA